MKKILLYNWVQFDDSDKRGGGVTVYLKNLVDQLILNKDYEVFFLSSGMSYDLKNPSLRIESTKNMYDETGRCHSFEIVNSPVLSPAYLQFHDLDIYLNDEHVYTLLREFIKDKDGMDVIHFHNIEGLSINVLNIKKDFPDTKMFFSLHNYFPFCPQVNLWWREQLNCLDFKNGSECSGCVGWTDCQYEKEMRSFEYYYNHSDKKISKSKYIHRLRVKRKIFNILRDKRIKVVIPTRTINPQIYYEYRQKNINLINKNVDKVLAVSERVKDIAIRYGIHSEIVDTSYIGTKVAENQMDPPKSFSNSSKLNIIYMGYVRRDKGFFFLLDALKCMDAETASKINVTFATRTEDAWVLNELEQLKEKFAEVIRYDGYNHQNMSKILEKQDLGIVPVLWEDNLPQVALEIAAHGVAVLSSDLGGAHELSTSEKFIFKNGDISDFINKLKNILNNRSVISEYWNNYKGLPTMMDHMKEIERYYF